MKVSILAVGRLKSGAEQSLFNRYIDLFNASGRNVSIAAAKVIEVSEGFGSTSNERKTAEGTRLLAHVGAARLIVLDEQGTSLTSYEFTAMFSRLRDEALDAAFAVGGPDGHSEKVKEVAHFRLALGKMTFPHGLVRVILAEQLYRAVTVMQGHPYHRP